MIDNINRYIKTANKRILNASFLMSCSVCSVLKSQLVDERYILKAVYTLKKKKRKKQKKNFSCSLQGKKAITLEHKPLSGSD